RLKDIQDLLMDTGMGTRAYSFIQQGQIDLILSTKPKDRRSLLEEAAGITRYKARRGEAERRLEDTRANLLRLDDILHELGKQQDSLKRQASKARKAQELDALIKATQRILLAGKATELEEAKARVIEQLDTLERGIAALTAQASEKASEVESQRHALDELNQAQDAKGRAILALDQRLSLAEQDRHFQEERIEEAHQQRDVLRGRLEELSGRSGDADEEMARLQAALKVAEVALEGRESLVSEAEETVALAAGALRHVESELKELRAQRAEAERASLAAQRERQGIHQKIAQAEGRLDALNHEESVRAPRLEGLQADHQRLERGLEAAETRMEEVDETVRVQARLHDEALQQQRLSGQTLREAEAALDAEERRLQQLGDLLRRVVQAEESQKALAWLKGRGEAAPPLFELVQIDETVRPDLERLLGHALEAIAVEHGAALAEAPGALQAALPEASEAVETPAGCEALASFLHWKRPSPRPLEALFLRCFRCTDEALPQLAVTHPGLGFVSPSLVKLPFAPIRCGVAAPEASPLKLRADLDASHARREERLDQVEELEKAFKSAQAQLAGHAERTREMEEDRAQARRELEDTKARLTSAKGQLREIEEAQTRADEQWEQIEAEIAALKTTLRELEMPEQNPEVERLTEAIHNGEGRHHEALEALEQRRQRLMETTQMRASAWAERDGVQRQVLQLQRGAFDLEAEKKRIQEDVNQAESRAAQASQRIQDLEKEIQARLEERQQLLAQQGELQPRIEHAAEALRVQEVRARELQHALENARQLHQECLVSGAQVQGSLDTMAKEIELALSMTVPDFMASITEEEREAWSQGELVHQTAFTEYQGRRLDLGSVNPLAIQELEEAEARLAFMNEQRADVMEAIGNLESTIREINATSEERFREAFEFIHQRFTEVFRDVFGGGTAHLALQDPKDLLECGIEITAQPPGKTAKALSLLSGGEKALTAISLLFAIFQFKPSPFCVLDEVDAPLDEANVGRFARLVHRMKPHTQFIVITHQKPTMVAADTLYGVTMEERGISRLVSVQLKEAQQLV
ncbi:MAG: chromosome segregation protein SMC, partial [Firmicutes bacterium]|nr:chromosome segregation protein SMC [Bacillota bacterium]